MRDITASLFVVTGRFIHMGLDDYTVFEAFGVHECEERRAAPLAGLQNLSQRGAAIDQVLRMTTAQIVCAIHLRLSYAHFQQHRAQMPEGLRRAESGKWFHRLKDTEQLGTGQVRGQLPHHHLRRMTLPFGRFFLLAKCSSTVLSSTSRMTAGCP